MTKEQYMEYHTLCCSKMISITKSKNADYTGTDPDPFSNFAKVEQLGICTTSEGFLTRMSDKLMRVISFSQKGVLLVRDESVEDTLLDLANYCILFAGYLNSKRPPQEKT